MPVGVVTTQPDRSPMFAISARVKEALRERLAAIAHLGFSMSDIQAQFSRL